MIKSLAILGSTGSIGSSTLSSIQGNKNYKVKLISTNSNIKKAFQQAIKFKIKDVIIEDKNKYEIYKNKFKKKKLIYT